MPFHEEGGTAFCCFKDAVFAPLAIQFGVFGHASCSHNIFFSANSFCFMALYLYICIANMHKTTLKIT